MCSHAFSSPRTSPTFSLLSAMGQDDDWVFGAGLRQDDFGAKKTADEVKIFKSPPPPPEKTPKPKPEPAPVPTDQDDGGKRPRRRPGELRPNNADSDDDDLFGGAAGVF